MRAETKPPSLLTWNYDLSNLNLGIGLFDLNKATSSKIGSEIKDYIVQTTWPAVQIGIDNAMGSSIKKLFLAASGLVLVVAGGQIVKEALYGPTKPPDADQKEDTKDGQLSRQKLLCAIGACMMVTGIGTILFCDRIAQLFTPL